MPIYKQPGVRGRLFVKVDIEMPRKLDLNEKDLLVLEKILPAASSQRGSRRPKASDSVLTFSKADAMSPFGAFGATEEEPEYDEPNPFSHFFR